MREARLLERIRQRNRDPQRREGEDLSRVIDSVQEHLRQILNTRQGNVPISEEYGTPDFTEFLTDYPQSLHGFERAIRHTVRLHEPRLRAVRVLFIPQEDDLLSLRFRIFAKLAIAGSHEAVVFESLVDSEGKISIKD
ncbi:MAG: type VI secretion system baseplate subunit TssE [Candidatus Electrothrix sp. GW3-4]|uniref:type VI secretion system baseplate subunit TssE n=1 Tax=Candidatus Electrothrix sp. GW3-4 TaxID=3126740 RepID=UPI0030CA85FB